MPALFEQFREVWEETLKPALAEWHQMSPEEQQHWQDTCPPQYRSGITFFFLNRLYGARADDPTS